MSFEFHINGNQTTFFILFVLRSCTFGFADYTYSPLCVFDFGIYARCYGCEYGNIECANLFRLGYFVIGISGTSAKVSMLNDVFYYREK